MTMHLRYARSGVGGGPKRTLQELAVEFGVSKVTLGRILASRDGPKPVLQHTNATVRSTWYAPKPVRDWWAALPEDVRKKATQ